VFDVDIAEGAPPLKLPYNVTGGSLGLMCTLLGSTLRTENPYSAAQRFLERNDLPNSYLDTVAQFVEKNTTGVSIGGGDSDYVDPFTGVHLVLWHIDPSRD